MNFADEADKAASKSDLPERLVRDIEKARAAEVKAAAAVETAEGRLAKAPRQGSNRKWSTANVWPSRLPLLRQRIMLSRPPPLLSQSRFPDKSPVTRP